MRSARIAAPAGSSRAPPSDTARATVGHFAAGPVARVAKIAASMTPRRLLPGLLTLMLLVAMPAIAGLPIVPYDGRDYVELARAAGALKTRLEVAPDGTQATL